jgi:hypothetical protein
MRDPRAAGDAWGAEIRSDVVGGGRSEAYYRAGAAGCGPRGCAAAGCVQQDALRSRPAGMGTGQKLLPSRDTESSLPTIRRGSGAHDLSGAAHTAPGAFRGLSPGIYRSFAIGRYARAAFVEAGGRAMGMLMIRCPKTKEQVFTGRYVESATFRYSPVFFSRTYCQHCHAMHEWFARDAWVVDAEYADEAREQRVA